MARIVERAAVYDAVIDWKQRCLLADGSVFGDGVVWTGEHAAELVRHFIERLDEGDRSFEEKLKDQLSHVSPGATHLAAEMLWVMMLFPDNIGQARKVELITAVWEWAGTPLSDPRSALSTLARGIGSGGTGYNNYQPFELQLLIRFTAAWKLLPPVEQTRLMGDGWEFAAWFDRLPDGPARQLRHMLFHLLFPDSFERVSSTHDKKRVDKSFAKLLQPPDAAGRTDRGPSAIARDRRLFEVRQILEGENPGEPIDFYSSPAVAARWRVQSKGTSHPSEVREDTTEYTARSDGARVWAIGAGEGASRWSAFFDDELVAIGWDELGNLEQYATRDDVQAAIKRVYEREQDPLNDSLACFQFCHEMAVGDEVFIKQGRNRLLGGGRVVGEYAYDETRPDFRNVRRVEWVRRGNWTLPDEARVPTKTLTDVTKYPAFRAFVKDLMGAGAPSTDAVAPYGVDDLMSDAFLARDAVEQIISTLRRRKNVILEGPPGVGKSFLARRLAYAMVGAEAPDNVQMIQFHQSYAYEDFIQGWRPNGLGGFSLRNGVFFEFCSRAQSHPTEPHVFVIDEINRGNMSKVFGELLLLIEADKRGPQFAIPLTYSESATDTFYVPENVYIIGLMNTADRSLAMVDYALRRRFAFKTLTPSFESPAFASTLREKGVDDATIARIVERVGAVNAEIVADEKNLGRGFAIGHSYFCPMAVVDDSAAWYDAIVRDEIAPLLTEYWFDDSDRVERCLTILNS